MKNLIVISFLLLLASCANRKEKDWTIKFKHDIGSLTISLPSEYDTLQKWFGGSDYRCADRQCIRIQSSLFSLSHEHFLYSNPDTFYGVTITQPFHADCDTGFVVNDSTLKESLLRIKQKELEVGVRKFEIEEVLKIDGQLFGVLGIEYPLTKEKTLQAVTYFNQEIIRIDFVNNTTNFKKEDFFQKSYECLKTIRFTNAQTH